MNRLRITLAAIAALALPAAASAHGGMYRGPGATMGPLHGPATADPGAVASPGVSGLPGNPTGDVTTWVTWWQTNQAPFLALKAHVRAGGTGTGSEGWFLGDGERPQEVSRGPSEDQIRKEIVPVLLRVLEDESDNDLLTGALVALAKVGPSADGADAARIEQALTRYLGDASQEVRETAAVSIGILASPRSIPLLSHLLWDTESGRKAVGAKEVDYRTRSFAAYGLGLVGARSERELDRAMVVSILRRALETDDTRSRDLEVACLVSLGVVPLATIETPVAAAGGKRVLPESSRLAQIDFVLAILRDEARENLARAQCPITLARLAEGLAEPHRSRVREELAADFLERIEKEKDRDEVLQSCVLALGALGTNDGKHPLDSRIRRALAATPKSLDLQARGYALIAAADVATRAGADSPSLGVDEVKDLLAHELAWGKSAQQPWAGLAAGILCRRLAEQGATHPAIAVLQRALRTALDEEGSPERVGAYALGAGLARSPDTARRMLQLVEKELQEDARGQVALALGLLGDTGAIEPLREIVARSKYRPEVLRQAAIALALLGDKDVPTQLGLMLKDAKSLAAQAAIASALGFTGDARSVEPLLGLLRDRTATEKARAFAAVALGNVADKEMLPWNSKIGFGINYHAAPATLYDPSNGTGILDIL